MNEVFYRAYEDKHRGSRELIKDRLKFYLPFLDKLKDIRNEQVTALDIGCGRCEWLELLDENNIKVKGVDLNESMLEDSKELHLDVELGNGIKYLASQDTSSLDIVSAFHLVEHITFEELTLLVKESFRVLKPAGLLILETPNCENIEVASYSFYSDPTHIKPIPSKFLSFLTEFVGFTQNKIVRLQEPQYVKEKEFVSLYEVITSVSLDYAVIAQKPAFEEELEKFNSLFEMDYGISLNQITEKFDKRIEIMESKLKIAEEQIEEFSRVLNKIVFPLKIILNFIKWFKTVSLSWISLKENTYPRVVIKTFLIKLKNKLKNYPKTRETFLFILKPFPKLTTRLSIIGKETENENCKKFESLNKKAKNIYNTLKNNIEQNKGQNI